MAEPVATSDTAFAAYLQCKGFPLSGTFRDGPRMHFCFSGPSELVTWRQKYVSGDKVPAFTFSENVKTLTRLAKQG